MPINLEIVTPEGLKYRAECEHVLLPSVQGQIDILPGHRPLVAMIQEGEAIVGNPGPNLALAEDRREGHAPSEVAIDKGFVRVAGDVVSVLTERAVDVEEIDLSEVEAARERAEAALKRAGEEDLDPAEIERLEAVTRFSIAQQLAKARKGQR
ncbi:MAG: ATP synthase F1 subunit epsilon [Opitutales bacterium]